MKKQAFNRLFSALLVLTMVVSAFSVLSFGTAAEDTAATGTSAVVKPAIPEAPTATLSANASVWDGSATEAPDSTKAFEETYQDGSETKTRTVQPIENAAQFMYVVKNATAETTTGVYYRLTVDIDLNKKSVAKADGRVFSGTLDGNGHIVANVQLATNGYSSINGFLFNNVTNGTIQDLTILGLNASAYNGSAALIGNTSGATITNVKVLNVTLEQSKVAALSLYNTGSTFKDIVVSGTIKNKCSSGSGQQAGVMLQANDCELDGVVNYANLASAKKGDFGMIVGQLVTAGSTVKNCINYGKAEINAGSVTVGGIVGYVKTSGCVIENCVNYGDLTNTSTSAAEMGGIVAIAYENQGYYITLKNCVNYGTITSGSDDIGGIMGRFGFNNTSQTASNAYNCVNYGTVTGSTSVGGIIGQSDGQHYAYQDAHIYFHNCANYGDVTATTGYAGGFAGDINRGNSPTRNYTVDGLYLSCTVTAATGAGAVVGYTNVSTAASTAKYAINNSVINVTLKASAETTKLATVTATSKMSNADPITLTATDTYFSVTGYTSTGAVAEVPHHYNASGAAGYEEEGVVADMPAGYLTDGAAVAMLNNAAAAGSYTPWVQTSYGPALLTLGLTLTAGNLALSGELTMNLKLDANKLSGIANMTKVNLVCGSKNWEGQLVDGYYVFAVTGIDAVDMADAKDYRLVVTTETEGVATEHKTVVGTTYSPLMYAQRMYNNAKTDDEVKGILTSMVYYMYAAEMSADGASNALTAFVQATGVEMDFAAYVATYTPEFVRGDINVDAINAAGITVGAQLKSGVNLIFTVPETVSGLTLNVAGETYTYGVAANGTITVTHLHAAMIANKLSLTFTTDSGEITGIYAVANFLDSATTSESYTAAQQELAMAAALYMSAVRAYAL